MSRRFVFDTVFGNMWTTSETEKAALANEEELLGKPENRVADREINEKITAPFQYSALYAVVQDQQDSASVPIRLLDLLPGTRREDIECELRTTRLKECTGSYEALSYVWGDVAELTPIQVNGATLQVGKNLRCALLNLRHQSERRTLWVDAVCIDEESLDERARQVAVMGDIYRGASKTVVWLGDMKATETALAYHTLQLLKEDVESGAQPRPSQGPVFNNVKNDSAVTEGLLRRPWWKRVWTAQEIVLATEAIIVCGRYQIDWSAFRAAIDHGLALEVWEPIYLGTFVSEDFEFYNAVLAMKALPARQTPAEELLDALLHTRRRAAGDARDKIFAVLGLVRDWVRDVGIRPDYRSITSRVYTDAASKIMLNSKNLDILGACFAFENAAAIDGLPTWVPDWSPTTTYARPLLNDPHGHRRTSHATKNSRAKPFFLDQGRTLSIEGHLVDRITGVSPVLREIDDSVWDSDIEFIDDQPLREILRDLGTLIGQAFDSFGLVLPHLAVYVEWERFVRQSNPTNPDPRTADPMSIYWQTLCTGTMAEGGYEETEKMFLEWQKSLEPARRLMKWKVDKAAGLFKSAGFIGYLKSTWHGYGRFYPFLKHCTERRLGRTSRGYLCLLPKSARAGDELTLLKGGRVPVVLRDEGEDGYMVFVGESYVHGIMDGWAWDEGSCREIRIH